MGKEVEQNTNDKPYLIHVEVVQGNCSGVSLGDTGETTCPNCDSPMKVAGGQFIKKEKERQAS